MAEDWCSAGHQHTYLKKPFGWFMNRCDKVYTETWLDVGN